MEENQTSRSYKVNRRNAYRKSHGCPYSDCKASYKQVVRNGYNILASGEKRKKWKCRICGRQWTNWFKRKTTPEQKAEILHWWEQGKHGYWIANKTGIHKGSVYWFVKKWIRQGLVKRNGYGGDNGQSSGVDRDSKLVAVWDDSCYKNV